MRERIRGFLGRSTDYNVSLVRLLCPGDVVGPQWRHTRPRLPLRSTAVVACGRGFPTRHTSSTPRPGRVSKFTRSSSNVRNVLYAYHLCLARKILHENCCIDILDLGNVRQIIMAASSVLDSLNYTPSTRFVTSYIIAELVGQRSSPSLLQALHSTHHHWHRSSCFPRATRPHSGQAR